jgi:hypothetical protein
VSSVLDLTTDPVDGFEQAVFLLISPEQGDSGEFIGTSGKQCRIEQRTQSPFVIDQYRTEAATLGN